MSRLTKRRRPALEPLETRQLLSTDLIGPNRKPINFGDLERLVQKRRNGVPLEFRRMTYKTVDGGTALITLYGAGTLQGTSLDPAGNLNLVYDNTNGSTRIEAKVLGGGGLAPLASVRDADVPIDSLDGVGANQVGLVNLSHYDLVEGGRINLTGGARSLHLHSTGPNSSVHLRSLPTSAAAGTLTPVGSGEGVRFSGQANGGVEVAEVGLAPVATTGTTTTTGFGSTAAASTDASTVDGLDLSIAFINGASSNPADLLPAQVFAYDAQNRSLIRFDTGTGNAVQTIPLTNMGALKGGVSIARVNGSLVALTSDGTRVQAFNAVTGASVGTFGLGGLAGLGFDAIDGIASNDGRTIVIDSDAGTGSNKAGLAAIIDVGASLASGSASVVGSPYAPDRALQLTGGAAGVTGLTSVYVTGSGFFDSQDPNTRRLGIVALSPASGRLRETARTAVSINSRFVSPAANGAEALGSIEGSLALITGIGQDPQTNRKFNTVTLLNPRTLATQGTVRLNHETPLAGLSESFHPELIGSALIDVRGNVRDFRGGAFQGLSMNVSGTLDRMVIDQMAESIITARPINHVRIENRGANVDLLSTGRSVGTRAGVTISEARPAGPLALASRLLG